MPPITNNDLQKERVVCRNYRNRRIGDFLKELDMTEGRSTGFPKIYKALKRNGSPSPQFETDEKNQYFLATVKIHPMFQESIDDKDDVSVNVGVNSAVLAEELKVTQRTIERDLSKLKSLGLIHRVGADKNGHWEVLDQIE